MSNRLFKLSNPKSLSFIALMGAIGNVLSGISIYTSPIIPSIPLGVIQVSLALDLSHLATFISALVGGPIIGAATGFVGGAIAAYQFGFSQGNLITGFGLPIGKAITGVIAGLLISKMNFLKQDRNPFLFILVTVLAYIPEGIYTTFLFIVIFPVVFGLPLSIVYLITTQILIKAFFEMVVMGIICGVLLSHQGFSGYVRRVFPKNNM